jgi:hypothetical protein
MICYADNSINFDLVEAFSYNCNSGDKRIIRKIIFENFDYIISEWKKYFTGIKNE